MFLWTSITDTSGSKVLQVLTWEQHENIDFLLVMRACEGCRRRKIKCDAATTNSWPCAACIRLKLNCVPPTVSYDKDYNPGSQTFELEKPQEYQAPSLGSQDEYQRPPVLSHMPQMGPQLHTPVTPTYADGMRMYQNAPYIEHQHPQEALQYSAMPQGPVVGPDINYPPPQVYTDPGQPPTLSVSDADSNWRNDSASVLSDALGSLRIDINAVRKSLLSRL